MEEAIRTGCMGWSYRDWIGPFYPYGTAEKDFLRLYSSVFDTVEVNSSFYRVPEAGMAERWRAVTPGNFTFTLKFPREIISTVQTGTQSREVTRFEDLALGLGEKLGAVLVLLPPSATYGNMFDWLREFTSMLGNGIRYAFEFRNASWFREEVYGLLRKKGFCFAWSSNQYVETPSEVTGDLIYLRLIGDRSITRFNRVRKDRTDTMTGWASHINHAIAENRVSSAYVFSNNHFAGFAPETINDFRRIAGMTVREWRGVMLSGGKGVKGIIYQTSLDFSGDTENGN